MYWKSSSSSAIAKTETMARSKSAKSVRGQISAPIAFVDPLDGLFAESIQPSLPRAYSQVHDPRQSLLTNGSTSPNGSGASRHIQARPAVHSITISDTVDSSAASEGSKRLSKSQPKNAPARKKSPIRNVLGRLFGRRKKTVSQLTTASEPPPQRTSAPPHMNNNDNSGPPRASGGANRSASVPVSEYDRALRSHSIGLDDVIAIQSARESLAMDQNQAKKRSSGSTSLYPLGARYVGDGKLAGLCPRPASVNEKDLHRSTAEDPDEIGRAITSDFSGLKRRSRSLSAMPFFEAGQTDHRRRSQEVKDLRESCFYGEEPLSPLSSESPEDDAINSFNPDLPDPPAPAGPGPTASEPFMFGNLISEEEAANRQQVEDVTLTSRINGIENRLHVLEDSVSLLRYKANPYTANGWKPSDASLRMGLGIQTSFSCPNTRNPHHSLSMGMPTSTRPSTGRSEGVMTESTSYSSGNFTTQQQQPSPSKGAARPISDHTGCGQNLQNPLHQPRSVSLGEEQYTAILGLLETERSARIVLEAQVQHLTRQLNMLLANKYAKNSSNNHRATPMPVSAFDYDADDHSSPGSSQRSSLAQYSVWHPQQHQQGYSLDDAESNLGASPHNTMANGADGKEEGDCESLQQYATPNEDVHAFGVFVGAQQQQQQHHDGSGSRPRALSLSRMTMGHMPTPVM